MNFRNLQYFLAAAEEKNITHAARKLYISQQSLSGHIAKLEEELGVPLFERGPELKLTYAGERLALIARQICSLEQEILRETGEISDHRRGRLRLGISYTCGRSILPMILPAFCAAHPLVEISLMEGNYRQLNEWLSRGEIDVLIGYMPIDVSGAQVSVILQERLFLACPKPFGAQVFGGDETRIRRARQEGADIRLFVEQPFILLKKGNRIRAMLDSYAAGLGFLPRVLLETENIETAFALAEQGMGLTLYPELFLRTLHADAGGESSPLDLFPLPGAETLGALAVAFMETGYRSPAVLDFIALCKQRAGSWEMQDF
jgi:DNA-binding transcriptional LysR family regulator